MTYTPPVSIDHFESVIIWENGIPDVRYQKMLTKETVAELPLAALSQPYERTSLEIELGRDEEFENLTRAEVMHIRLARKAAGGSMEAAKFLLERMLGKPKQSVETKSLSMTYTQYLEELTRKENEDNTDN